MPDQHSDCPQQQPLYLVQPVRHGYTSSLESEVGQAAMLEQLHDNNDKVSWYSSKASRLTSRHCCQQSRQERYTVEFPVASSAHL